MEAGVFNSPSVSDDPKVRPSNKSTELTCLPMVMVDRESRQGSGKEIGLGISQAYRDAFFCQRQPARNITNKSLMPSSCLSTTTTHHEFRDLFVPSTRAHRSVDSTPTSVSKPPLLTTKGVSGSKHPQLNSPTSAFQIKTTRGLQRSQ